MPNRSSALGVLAWTLGAFCACGYQKSSDYQGEPLFTFDGEVELTEEAESPLVPALAFRGLSGYWSIMQVDVEGEFPTGFTFRVFDPPPEIAMQPLPLWSDESRLAGAYIVAVSPDVGPGFQHASVIGRNSACGADEPCQRVRYLYCYTDPEDNDEFARPVDMSGCYVEVREWHTSST